MNRVWGPHAQLGDGGFPVRRTIAKTFGRDDATRLKGGRSGRFRRPPEKIVKFQS